MLSSSLTARRPSSCCCRTEFWLPGTGSAACRFWWEKTTTAAACLLSPLPTTSWAMPITMSWAPEIVRLTPEGVEQLSPPGQEMKICAFLWTYYGYPNSNYEGKNVEVMRYRNGQIMAREEMKRGTLPEVDYVAGVPDSGVPHAIGFSNQSQKPFARPFVKYTPTWPRSFMPSNQAVRNQVAKMKQIPVPELIQDKKLLFVDDSIVRGTQLRETVEFLYSSGAKEVHMRSACPPIMYGCKYLNFSSSNSDLELLARRMVQKLEGDEGQEHLTEYADGRTQRGAMPVEGDM